MFPSGRPENKRRFVLGGFPGSVLVTHNRLIPIPYWAVLGGSTRNFFKTEKKRIRRSANKDRTLLRAQGQKKHPVSVSEPNFFKDCKLYIIISFLILNYIERFFRNKKY